MKGRPAYGIDVLIEEVIQNIETTDTTIRKFNNYVDKFKVLSHSEKKRIISEVFSVQSEYLYDAFANNQDTIYIPFIGKFHPRCKSRVRKEFKDNNIEFTEEDVKLAARKLYKETHSGKHHIEEVTVTVTNLDEIFNKFKLTK